VVADYDRAREMAGATAGERMDRYFGGQRRDVLSLVPTGEHVVLDVGCGTGASLQLLREAGKCKRAIGIEYHPDAAARARETLDEVYEGDVERMELPIKPGSVDVLLCLDVLEHLVDPWRTLVRLARLLRPGGVIVASIPNVRNYKVTLPLLFRGRFDYVESGILDRTHLRFFTRESARALIESTGARIEAEGFSGIGPGGKREVVNRLTGGLFADWMIAQFYFRARIGMKVKGAKPAS